MTQEFTTTSAQSATWLHLASRRTVVLRAVKYSLVVGTLLTLINHGGELIHGHVTGAMFLQILLTFAVPYAVATSASVSAAREMEEAITAARQGKTSRL
jgi:hypothetical protein